MAKQTRQLQVKGVDGVRGKGHSYEHHESYDDSLLPDAAELSKLKELDPTIIDWIKLRAEKEQDNRLEFNSKKISLIEKNTQRGFRIDVYTVTCALVVILSGMGLSCFLIHSGQVVVGSVFAGGTIILAANSFLNFRKVKENKKPNS